MRLAAPLLVALASSGCATVAATRPAPLSAASSQEMASTMKAVQAMQEAQRAAEAQCAPLKDLPVGTAEEARVGRELTMVHARQAGPLLADELGLRVATVGKHLARYSARPHLAWTFAVVQNDTPSTWSAPGGYVLISTGLLSKLSNEAELAGVLAHEIAHVSLQHPLTRYREARVEQCRLAKSAQAMISAGMRSMDAGAARFAPAFESFDFDSADSSFRLFILDAIAMLDELRGYPSESEFAADDLALRLVAHAGYDAAEYEKLLLSLGEQKNDRHPKPADRAAKLKALREGELAPFATGTAKPALQAAP